MTKTVQDGFIDYYNQILKDKSWDGNEDAGQEY